MIADLLTRLGSRDTLDAAEEGVLRAAVAEVRELAADHVIVHEGDEIACATLLLDGWLCRYKDLRDGGRQISALHVPGDFADLHGFTLRRLDQSIMTLAPSRIALVPHARLKAITEQQPRLARLLWFSTNVDAAIHREWEVSLGRRGSAERVAHLFCELQCRLALVGRADAGGFAFPATQPELSECVGLTPVHVNRTLRQLREAGLAEFRSGQVAIPDLARLRRFADFRPDYLYQDPAPI